MVKTCSDGKVTETSFNKLNTSISIGVTNGLFEMSDLKASICVPFNQIITDDTTIEELRDTLQGWVCNIDLAGAGVSNFDVDFATLDATTIGCTPAVNITDTVIGNLQVCGVGLNGTPCITLEMSNDGIKWNPYSEYSSGLPLSDSCNFLTKCLLGNHYRICVDPKDNTTGTIEANWNLKKC